MARITRMTNIVAMILVALAGISAVVKRGNDGAQLAGALIALAIFLLPLYMSWSALGNREPRRLKRAFRANVVAIGFFILLAVYVVFRPDGPTLRFFAGMLLVGAPFVVNLVVIRRLSQQDKDAPVLEPADQVWSVDNADALADSDANYVIRHWRGDLPLGQSYWVNGTLIGAVTAVAANAVSDTMNISDSSLRVTAAIGLGMVLLSLLIWIWSVVGIWRSAGKHISRTGARGWALAARGMVMLGVVVIAGKITTSLGPQVKELGLIAIGLDPMGKAELIVTKDNRSLIINGPLREGVAQEVKRTLDMNTSVRVVALNSPGGRLLEARQLAAIVQSRDLDTYVQERCESACTFVFLAGKDRASTPNARIGFHQPSFVGLDVEAQRKAIDEMARTYRAARLPEAFVKRITATPPTDMWYPTREELIAANVVTRLSLGGEVSVAGSALASKGELLLALRSVPLWQAMEQKFPQHLEEAVDLAWAIREKGGSDRDMTNAMRGVVTKIYPLLLKNADDALLDEFLDVLDYQMTAARAVSPEACARLMASQLNILQTLPREAFDKEQRFLLRALSSPARTDVEKPTEAELQAAIRSALATLPAQYVDVIGNPGAYAGQNELSCDATLAFYRALAALPEHDRHLALRGMFQS